MYYFVDRNGKYLANFEPLVMTDAAGAMSNDIKMDIKDNLLTLTANDKWLNDPLRVYPVDIDPTIVHEQNPDFSSGTENRSQVSGTGTVETKFKELPTDINTVGLWHFNEGTSTTAYDASGNNNNGTLTNGPVWNGPTDTQVGLGKSSLKFDDVNDYVTTADAASLDLTTNGTIEAWVKPNAIEDNNWIVCKASNYCIGINSTGAVLYTGASAQNDGGVGVITANQWYHIAVTNNNTTATYYVNGVQTGTDAVAWGSTLTNALEFGRDGGTNYFDGTIDEIKISNVVRSPEEIAASASRYPYSVHQSPVIDFGSTPNSLDSLNYTANGVQTGDAERPFSSDGLIAQWNFNETSGTVAYNTAGSDSCSGTPSNCNGTLTSFASTSSQDQAAGTGWTANNKRWGAGALSFDNTDDYVNVPYVAALNPSGKEVSIETWINGTLSTSDRILNHTSVNAGYGLRIDDGSALNLEMIIGDGTSYHYCTKAHGMSPGTWNHVAGTYNGYQFDLYVNGKNIGTCVDPMTPSWGSVAVVLGGAPDYWGGTLDAIKLYGRALTATEILANSQVGNIEFQTRTGATATPNDGTWEAWKTTSGTGDTQIDAMDATTGWAWDGNTSDPTSVALDTTTKIEGTGSLKNIIGMPEADANTVGLWHMDETSGSGAYIKDATANANHGTPTGTSVVDGFYGKSRNFNGSSDYVSVGALTGGTAVKSVDFWAYPTSTTTEFIDLDAGTHYINATTGTVAATGFTSPTIYVNGVVSSTIVANQWQHIAITTGTSFNASNTVIGKRSTSYLSGKIDEVKISNTARSADEIAEAYRAGRDHRISKTISSADLSAKTKLPFYVASDRPGTFLEATVGESAYANYEPDANTVGLWHLDEITGSGAFYKDSSGNGNNGTATGTPKYTQGKTGGARYFNGTSDFISFGTNSALFTATGTIDAWTKLSALPGANGAWIYSDSDTNAGRNLMIDGSTSASCGGSAYQILAWLNTDNAGGTNYYSCTGIVAAVNTWYHVTMTYTGTTLLVYVNGVLAKSTTYAGNIRTTLLNARVGTYSGNTSYLLTGTIDEVRNSNIVRTPDEIRQAYEIGKRTHQITNDFVTSPQATYTSGTSVTINNPYGTTNLTDTLSVGDTMIFKENVNGTETISQSIVTAITNTSSVYGTVTLLAAPTFPSGGYTTAAKVFKWQREYFDLTQVTQSTHRDAITRLTLRVTDGSQGANVWIDDFESADYSDGSRVAIGSTVNRYFQYRAIINGSPTLTNMTINYNSGTTAQAPKTKDSSTDFSASGATLDRVVDTGSSNSPQLELAYKELPVDINTVGLWHMNENAANTCTGGVNDVCDKSGNVNDGAFNGDATFTTSSKLGASATTFDGTGDYISVADATVLRTTGQMTVESWIKTTATTSKMIVSKGTSNSSQSTFNFGIGQSAAGTLNYWTANGGVINATTKTVNDGNWHHVAASFDPAIDQVNLYIDGLLEKTATDTSTPYASTCPLIIGARDDAAAGSCGTIITPWNGQIDEVRISNIARTPEEIKLDAQRRPYGVYTSDVQNLGANVSSINNLRWTENGVQTGDGETPYSTNALVAQWNFNETSGTTAVSGGSCGSTCNGTVTSMTTTSQDAAAGDGWTSNNRRWGTGALMFDGTDGHITIPNSNTVSSVEAWINPTSIASINIMQLTTTATITTSAAGIITAGAGFTTPTIYLNGSTTDITLKAGLWNHVVVSSATGISTSTGYIGRVSTSYFKGIMDAVRLYNRTLSAVEVQSNYNNGNVELQTRTGTTTTPNDGTWEAWKPSGNSTETQLDNLETLSPVQKISTTNLVGYWKLDEVSGSRADSVGSTTLTDNNTVTSKAGHLNLAGQLTSANTEYLSATNNSAITAGDIDFTLSAWVYPDTNPSLANIISHRDTSAGDYFLRVETGVPYFGILNAGATVQDLVTGPTITTGTWSYIVAWHNATTNKIYIQVNNGTVAETTETITPGGATATFRIGADENSGRYWNGRIDEVAMWKRVLTADERQRLYEDGLDKTNDAVVGGINRSIDTTTKFEGTGSEKLTVGSPSVDSSTVALWHMDETSGTGAYIKDSTAGAFNGTPTGTTSVDGFYAKTRNFNGSSDFVDIGTGPTSVKSVEFWVNPTTTTEYFVNLTSTTDYIWANAGTVTATGFTSPTIYVDGAVSSTIVAGKWQHVAVTSATAENASNLDIGRTADANYLEGKIDEVRLSSEVRTAEEIAEGYRAGRDHRVSKTLTSTDLTSKTKLPFYVASDRPGTFLEATVGESAYANYEPDANTTGFYHFDEQTGTANTYIKDSSGNGYNSTTITGTTFVQGKIGKARTFNGTSDYIQYGAKVIPIGAKTIETWINTTHPTGGSTRPMIDNIGGSSSSNGDAFQISAGKIYWANYLGTPGPGRFTVSGNTLFNDGLWHHLVGTWDGTTTSGSVKVYVDGKLDATGTADSTESTTQTYNLRIGADNASSAFFPGSLDEVRFSNVVRTPDEIRQAYEIGKRTHTITNDFVTTPQAAYSSGTSVTINNPYGTTNLTDTLALGDTMIFKENVGGTETVSQAVVTAITNTSSVYGTVTLLAAPTFPSGGYTTAAKVFKWQREFFDITSSLASQRDAVTRLSLRVIDGSQGANVWIDDIKSAGPYLSNPSTRNSTVASTPQKFVQYRVIFSTTDGLVSPNVTSVALTYNTQPKKVVGSDTLTAAGSLDRDGNVHLGSNNVKKVAFYDRTKDQISYALDFDNSNDYVAVGTGPTSVKTVEFWVNPNSTTTEFIDLNGSAYINVTAGTIGTTGFTSPTVYVDGAVSSTVVANKWQHIAVTTGTALNATALNFGKRSTSYFNGLMDEVALYSSALTAAQVTTDYNNRRLAGTETGLVALYHFDEGQGTRAYDSTGGFHGTLTNMAATAWVNSQNDRDQSALSVQTLGVDPNWGNGVSRESSAAYFDGTGDYASVADSADWNFGSGDWTIDFWHKGGFLLGQTPGINDRWVIYTAGNSGTDTIAMWIYALGITITGPTINLDNWNHTAIVRNGSSFTIYANGVAGTPVTNAGAMVDIAAELRLMQQQYDAQYRSGSIDELRITKGTAYWTANFTPSRRSEEAANDKLFLHFDEGALNLCSGGTNDGCDASSASHDVAFNGDTTFVTDARAIQDNNARYISLGSSSSSPLNKGMEIYAVSTTQFKYRWTGDQVWSSAVNFSSYAFATPTQLGTTGVYVGFDTTNGTFGDESYFLIPSWAVEQFSSNRGNRRSFPERSYLIAIWFWQKDQRKK